MPKPRHALRLLLIQVREHEAAAEQEHMSFLRRCGVAPEQMRVHNIIHRPDITWSDVGNADAVMIGGAGSRSATREHPFSRSLGDVVRRCLDEERPFYGSCWGHQFLATVLGGSVITDRANQEVGSFEVRLTEAGRRDPLLAGFGPSFVVQLGHKDRVDRPPPGIEVLASTPNCVHQLIRVAGKPAYGSQFHAEMNDDDMRKRVEIYRDQYLDHLELIEAFEASLRPSPDCDRLLDAFLSLYC